MLGATSSDYARGTLKPLSSVSPMQARCQLRGHQGIGLDALVLAQEIACRLEVEISRQDCSDLVDLAGGRNKFLCEREDLLLRPAARLQWFVCGEGEHPPGFDTLTVGRRWSTLEVNGYGGCGPSVLRQPMAGAALGQKTEVARPID